MGNGPPAMLEFSPWLNALVGGRGTGKSTVIHGFRLVARRDDELKGLEERSTPRLTFDRFNMVPQSRMDEGGLKDTTEIRWIVMRDGVRHRLHWRQSGTGPVVEEESEQGDWIKTDPQTITSERFPMRLFSQGQIAEMAGDNQLPLLQVIDEASGVAILRDTLDTSRNAFYAMKTRIRELDGRLAREGSLSVELQDVERKLRLFEATGHTAVLRTYRHRERQQAEVVRQFESVEELALNIDETAALLQVEERTDDLFDEGTEEDRNVTKAFSGLSEGIRKAAQELSEAAQRLREQARIQREELTNSSWQQAVDVASSDYSTLVEELKRDGINDLDGYRPFGARKGTTRRRNECYSC